MATMTPEEREEYRRRIADRLKNDMGKQDVETKVTTTVTTTTYVADRNSKDEIPLEDAALQAHGLGSDEDKVTVVYGEEGDNRLSSPVRVVQIPEQIEEDIKTEEDDDRLK